MKVLFIDSVHPVLQEMLEERGYVCNTHFDLHRDQIKGIIHEYQGLVIRSKIELDRELIDLAVNLRFIARSGAGLENIDVDYAKRKDILFFHAPEGNRDAVGEHALGMLLSLFNNLCKANSEVRKGKWNREGNRGIEVGGKTVGIIGYGNTGSAFAKKLQGFDARILAYDKYKSGFGNGFVKEAELDEIFENSQILSLHVPLTKETTYMVNAEFLKKFQHPIYLINTSRGKVVNTADLVSSLKSGKVAGACLDVLEYESLSFENLNKKGLPEPFQYLIEAENVMLSPHVAGWTHESYVKLSKVLGEKIIAEFGSFTA